MTETTNLNVDARIEPLPIDHTINRPWRDEALGYLNYELSGPDGTRHMHAGEDLVWSAFNDWPPDGHRVSFRDGNPNNRAVDNLELLSPQQAAALDLQNERIATAAIIRAGYGVRVLRDGTYLVAPVDGGAGGYRCFGIGGLVAVAQVELGAERWRWDCSIDPVLH